MQSQKPVTINASVDNAEVYLSSEEFITDNTVFKCVIDFPQIGEMGEFSLFLCLGVKNVVKSGETFTDLGYVIDENNLTAIKASIAKQVGQFSVITDNLDYVTGSVAGCLDRVHNAILHRQGAPKDQSYLEFKNSLNFTPPRDKTLPGLLQPIFDKVMSDIYIGLKEKTIERFYQHREYGLDVKSAAITTINGYRHHTEEVSRVLLSKILNKNTIIPTDEENKILLVACQTGLNSLLDDMKVHLEHLK